MNTNKQINIIVLLVSLSVLATGLYTWWDPERSDAAKDKQLEASIERGAWLFSQNCVVCHGDAGEGGAASNRLRLAPAINRPDLQGIDPETGELDETLRSQAYQLVFNTIECGRVGKAMPTWGVAHGGTLNDTQIGQLATFITQPGEHGWELSEKYAIEGVPEFGKHGYDGDGLALAQALAEGDTVVMLNTIGPLAEGLRLQIGEEILLIEEVDIQANSVTVERGIGTTNPEAHESGAQILRVPVPPDPAPVTQPACGQNLPPEPPDQPDEAPSTELSIVAQGTAWNKARLSAVAAAPLTLTVDNRDAGTVHNIHFFVGAEPGGEDVAQTELETGPVIQTLNFGPLDAGEYFYVCDVHTNMEGVLTASVPGATGEPGAGEPDTEAPADPANDTGAETDPTSEQTPAQ